MKNYLNKFIKIILPAILLTGCLNYKKLITDEVVLKDGNSHTGTIIQCDTAILKIEKVDESKLIIPWATIDTVKGKKLRSLFFGANFGYYKVPFFSVFRNQAMAGESMGMQYKAGLAYRGNKQFYLNLFYLPSKPYSITKFGFGYQQYLGKTSYLKKNAYFVGGEVNMMNAKYNNGAQTTIEPFTGFERKCNEHFRFNFKYGLQYNFANKNNSIGVNLSLGVTFMKRNFKKHYIILNKEHRLN